ncbi:MAG: gamma-glutamyl-gamma-aminobutyrate hydrolase family protein [candidate division WOR-3 bacterium]
MIEVLLVDCYPDNYKDRVPHYIRAINASGRVAVTVDYRSVRAGYRLPPVQAVVVSGSPMMLSETDPPERLTAFVLSLDRPVLGICYGHQLLARLAGARVYRGERIERIETIRVSKPHPIFTGLGNRFPMLESHCEYVLPNEVESAGFEVLATSSSCPVETIRHRTRPWFGVQFHPERSAEQGTTLVSNFVRLVVESLRA